MPRPADITLFGSGLNFIRFSKGVGKEENKEMKRAEVKNDSRLYRGIY